MTVDQVRAEIEDRLPMAREEAADSSASAMNSYGAGYDRGYLDALEQLLRFITTAPDLETWNRRTIAHMAMCDALERTKAALMNAHDVMLSKGVPAGSGPIVAAERSIDALEQLLRFINGETD